MRVRNNKVNIKDIAFVLKIFFILFLVESCKDEVPTSDQNIPPVTFNFTNPNEGNEFALGDTIFIDGMIAWENELHGYEITLTDMSNDSIVFSAHGHEDALLIHITKIWVNKVTHLSDMRLTIDALTDHRGGKQSKEMILHCYPL